MRSVLFVSLCVLAVAQGNAAINEKHGAVSQLPVPGDGWVWAHMRRCHHDHCHVHPKAKRKAHWQATTALRVVGATIPLAARPVGTVA